jgi:hypothetical protein
MRFIRLLCFAALAGLTLAISFSGAVAQVPGGKTQPQLKPIDPTKKSDTKTDTGGILGGMPKTGNLPPIQPPIGGIGGGGMGGGSSGSKSSSPWDDIKWPKDINGKTLETYVREMKSSPDAGLREAAVRALEGFGPRGRDAGCENLVYALRDSDINVRLAALDAVPIVLLAYAKEPDSYLGEGLKGIVTMLDNDSSHVRFQATLAASQVGPYFKMAMPQVISKLSFRTRDPNSWQVRRAAVGALAAIGRGNVNPEDPSMKTDPDVAAVTAVLDSLKGDTCAAVRAEAANSLLLMGPVAAPQLRIWRSTIELSLKNEKDKAVLLWTRVALLRNDPAESKKYEPHLNAIASLLANPEPMARAEATRALGVLGEEASAKLQELLDVATNPKENPLVVAGAISAVSSMRTQAKTTIPLLQKIKETHQNDEVKKVASEAIDILMGKRDPKKEPAKKN